MRESYGSDWSDQEIDLVIADYFTMLGNEVAGEQYNKAQHNQALQALIGRSRKAIEFKHCNVSAVLEHLGIRYIRGYRPLHHYQNALITGIERYLTSKGEPQFVFASGVELQLAETPALWIGPPPVVEADEKKDTDRLRQLVRRFDPAERDACNRELGKCGEELVYRVEQERLAAAGREDLAKQVEWTSQVCGDGAGYDIRSFEANGSERLIEVKTTNGPAKTPFFLSENELCVSRERTREFCLLRLYTFSEQPSAYELRPPWQDRLLLQAQSYRATLI